MSYNGKRKTKRSTRFLTWLILIILVGSVLFSLIGALMNYM